MGEAAGTDTTGQPRPCACAGAQTTFARHVSRSSFALAGRSAASDVAGHGTGMAVAPSHCAPKKAPMKSGPLGKKTATRSPKPTPCSASARAHRCASGAASQNRNVSIATP